jgi:general secretion pathway protein D
LLAAVVLALGSLAQGQEVAADQAKAMLQQGIKEYKSFNFKQAQATLLKANDLLKEKGSALSDEEKKQLNEHLEKAPDAIRQQGAAQQSYKDAEKALRGGQFDEAINGFGAAAASEFLNPGTRQDAQAQLALAKMKKDVAKAAAAAAATEPAPAPAPTPAPAPLAAADSYVGTAAPAPSPAPAPAAAAPAPSPAPAPAPAATVADPKANGDLTARQAKARELLARGKQALDDNDGDAAMRFFQRALELDSELTEADTLLKNSTNLLARKSSTQAPGSLGRLQRQMLVAREAALVEINRLLNQSRQQLTTVAKSADFESANKAAHEAKQTLEANKLFFGAQEWATQLARVDEQITLTETRKMAFERSEAARQAVEIEKMSRERVLQEQATRMRRVVVLTEQARELRSQKQYGKSLAVVEEILLIDPKNPWALQERDVLAEFDLLVREGKAVRNNRFQEQETLIDLRESEIPWYQYLRYPKNWRQLTEERKAMEATTSGDSPTDAALRAKLRREIERLTFNEIDFKEVVNFLREYSDANIHVNWRALQAAGIEPTTKVSVDVRRVSVKRALELVLRDVSGAAAGADAELTYVVDGGVLTISTKADLARKPIRRVYDVRDLLVPVPDFQGPRIDLDISTSSSSSSSSSMGGTGSTGGTSGSGGGIFDTASTTNTQEKIKIITKEDLTKDFITLIRRGIDKDSWSDPEGGGGGTGFIQVMNGQLVVTQTAENHQSIAELLEKLREAKTIQIMIEARFIMVDSGFLNRVGFDVDIFFNIGSRLGSTSTTDPWTGATVPTSGGSSGWGNNGKISNRVTPVRADSNSLAFTRGISTLVGSDIGSALGTGSAFGMAGTFLDDIQVNFLIEATQANLATRTLTAPKICLSNGQRAYITVATQQAYIREVIPVVSGNATANRPVIGYIPTGSVLDVAATASADRRYVLMTVRPQVSSNQTSTAGGATGGTTPSDPNAVGGIPTFGGVQLPTVAVQDLQTTVSVPDGGTLVLGGQKMAGEIEREVGPPILSKVPVLNRFFVNKVKVRDERTLLILIKPKILINEVAEKNEKLYLEEPRLP